ncbi:hypothetical protein DsansV1_C13g0116651 [Dioscorea sansibarensis]
MTKKILDINNACFTSIVVFGTLYPKLCSIGLIMDSKLLTGAPASIRIHTFSVNEYTDNTLQ